MKREVSPNGERDENVFDIQQGVSINIFVKKEKRRSGLAKVYYADYFGRREKKYEYLSENSLDKIPWSEVTPNEPFYFYIPRNESNRGAYEQGFSIRDLMPEHTTGIVTARDGLVINADKDKLLSQIELFADPNKSDDEIRSLFFGNKKAGKYLSGDSRGWKLTEARKRIRNNDHSILIQKIAYRPYDVQYIYYTPDMVDWGREKLMSHLLAGENYGLIIPRQAATDNWSHVQITRYMADNRIHYSNKGIPIECPLYLYVENQIDAVQKTPNLNLTIIGVFEKTLGMKFVPNDRDIKDGEFGPLDVLDYIYAVLHSHRFRSTYLEFLKYDFPRIPYPQDSGYFKRMKAYGRILRELHTDESDTCCEENKFVGSHYPLVEHPVYSDGKILLNKSDDAIINVPDHIWDMFFGGYKPLQKWLKDRRGTVLSAKDIRHFRHIVYSLTKTDQIMQEIDQQIEL